MNQKTKNIVTWSQVHFLVGFGSVLITLLAAWFNLSNNINLIGQKQDTMYDQIQENKAALSTNTIAINDLKLQVSSLKQTIDENKANGKITLNNTPSTNPKNNPYTFNTTYVSYASSKPTPSNKPQDNNLTYNNTYYYPQPTSGATTSPRVIVGIIIGKVIILWFV